MININMLVNHFSDNKIFNDNYYISIYYHKLLIINIVKLENINYYPLNNFGKNAIKYINNDVNILIYYQPNYYLSQSNIK